MLATSQSCPASLRPAGETPALEADRSRDRCAPEEGYCQARIATERRWHGQVPMALDFGSGPECVAPGGMCGRWTMRTSGGRAACDRGVDRPCLNAGLVTRGLGRLAMDSACPAAMVGARGGANQAAMGSSSPVNEGARPLHLPGWRNSPGLPTGWSSRTRPIRTGAVSTSRLAPLREGSLVEPEAGCGGRGRRTPWLTLLCPFGPLTARAKKTPHSAVSLLLGGEGALRTWT